MFRFVIGFLAIIGFLFILLVVLGVWTGLRFAEQGKPHPEPESVVLMLNLDQLIVEQNDPSPLDLAIHEDVMPLYDILHAIDLAKGDAHVKGIVARMGSTAPSLTQAQEIRAALARFRASGKFTYVFAPSYGSFGMGSKTYYLASAFENIWLQPVGSVGLSGLAMEMPFGKTALKKIGIDSDFIQREEYKSAFDNITRDEFAPQVKTEMKDMLNDLSEQIAGGIADSRKWDANHVRHLMNEGPYTDEEASKNGLVTTIGYVDELEKEIDRKAGKDAGRPSIEDYLDYDRSAAKTEPTKIALIYGTGMIVDKNDGPADISGDKLMGADQIAGAFDDAVDNKEVKAILFRVDSPGGSPEASETIRRALVHAQKQGKPVIVSMGSVAASGGYWVSMNADRIISEPATLTGSIGVIGGKFILAGLMQKVGVNWDMVKTADNAGMWSMINDFTPAQKERVNALMDQTYHAFVKNVSDARHIPMEKMPDISKGRVWTGAQALKINLVDELGGYDVALAAVHKALKLDEKAPLELEVFPAPETPVERVLKVLKNVGGQSAMLGSAILQWQKIQTTLGPVLRDTMHAHSLDIRMPGAALNAVR